MRTTVIAATVLVAAVVATGCSTSQESADSSGADALSQDNANAVIARLGKLADGATLTDESGGSLDAALAKLDASFGDGEVDRWRAGYGNPASIGASATKVTKGGRDYHLVSRRWLSTTATGALWISVGYAEDENGGFAYGETHKLDFSTGDFKDDQQFFVTDADAAIRRSGQGQHVDLDDTGATPNAGSTTASLHIQSGDTKTYGNGFACNACTTALWAVSKGSVAVAGVGIGLAGFEVANTFCAHVAAVVGVGTVGTGAVPAFGICEAAFVAGAIAVYLVGRTLPSDDAGQRAWCNNHFNGVCASSGPAACGISAITTGADGKTDLTPEHVCERVVPCAKVTPCSAVPALCSGVILNGDQKLVDTCTKIAVHACAGDANNISLNTPQDTANACAQIVSAQH